jgi:AraC-like DNA-binding protein
LLVSFATTDYAKGMSADRPTEYARFHRPSFLPGVELVSVAYGNRRFPEHCHEEYVIGAVTAGAETLSVGRKQHLADAGTVLRLNPTEAHANTTIGTETLRYSVLYVPETVIASFRDEEAALPRFDLCVTKDTKFFQKVCSVHAMLSSDVSGKLEQESALASLVHTLISDETWEQAEIVVPHAAAEIMRSFIKEHYADGFGLHDLSMLTGLSTFHLIRTFKRNFGLTPLAYRDQLRIIKARRFLLQGQSTAQIALKLGYADQSHFTRQFQRIVGTSPQRYARSAVAQHE